MTVSLMSMLGGRVNLSAGTSEKDDAGKVEVQSVGGDAAFETIMAAAEQKEISAAELQAFFASRGIDVNVVQQAEGGVDFAALNGQMQKLPSDVAVAVQEFLVGATTADAKPESKNGDSLLQEMISQLPARELTAEELSEIVQATNIEPVVIFDALRNTPAASPNLAAAMVDDMGAAAADAGLPLPKPVAQVAVAPELAEGEVQDDALVAGQKPAQVPALTPEQQQVIQKIVNVLQGASEQAELPGEWLSRLAALSAAKLNAEKTSSAPAVQTSGVTVSTLAEGSVTLKPVVNDNEPVKTTPAEKSAHAVKSQELPAQPQAAVSADVAADVVVDADGVPLKVTTTSADSSAAPVVADQSGAAKSLAPVTESAKAAAPTQTTPDEAPAEQVAVRFRQAVSNGDSSIQIKLKPLELGTVEVRIETAADGVSRVHVSAEKRDTLEMLQRDARSLERALQDLGFKTDNSSLSFNMRGDQNQQQASGHSNGNEQGKGQFSLDGGYVIDETHDDLPSVYDVSKAYGLTFNRGVDISV